MTFPDLTPYYVDGDLDVKRRIEESYRQGITLQQQFWNEADIDTRFYAGDQTLWNQIYGPLPLQNRRQFQFNRIRRIINMITGYQRRNRKTTIVTPVHSKDQQTADDMTAVVQWINNTENVYNTISDAFQGACVSGFNMLSCWVDYRFDPVNGDIRVENKSFNSIMIDPTFKSRDLRDANYIWTRKWMSKKQVMSLLPGREDEIEALPISSNRDDKFIFLPENFQYGIRNLVPYDEYWYLDYRDVTLLVDLETGDTKEWEGDKDTLQDFLKMFPSIRTTKIQKQTCRLAIMVSNRVLYDGPNPYNSDRYPFIPIFAYFEPNIPYYALKMQGVVRGLRDAQYLYNRRKVIELDILESQINSGIKYKESALVDPNDAFLNGQGRALALRDSASMDDVQVIPPPDVPSNAIELSKMLGEEISQMSGVNEELLGSAMDDKAGILSMLRQGAGLTTLQLLFDQLDMSQKMLGELCIDYVQNNFEAGKVERILGRKPSDDFYNKLFPKFDCNVEEGALTSSQKQMQAQQLLELRNMGINIPDSVILDAVQIQNKEELIKAIEAQGQSQQQMEQESAQMAMYQQQMVADSMAAKAESDRALAAERLNKIGLDQALNTERMAKAQQERDMSALNKVRAAKELEDLDLAQLQKMLDILAAMKAHSDATEPQPQPVKPPLQQVPEQAMRQAAIRKQPMRSPEMSNILG